MTRAAAATVSILVAAACSVLVPNELDVIRCLDDGAIGPPACPVAHVCARGACAMCLDREACSDGIDNDCDGRTDELGCGDSPDAGGDAGDAGGAITEGGPPGATIGELCASDAQCDPSAFCLEPTALGMQGGRFCTRGCCSSDECGQTDAVCWPTSGGAAVCVPASRVARVALGTVASGNACQNDGECRSGWCGASEGVCLDVCCRHSDCPAPSAPDCTRRSMPGVPYAIFSCGQAPGTGAYQDSCYNGPLTCRSGLCIAGDPPSCTTSCCTTSDCGGTLECRYAGLGESMLRVCALTGSEGSLDVGELCTQHTDCRSAWCLTVASGESMCTDTCCRDADCGDTSRFGCRLAPSNTHRILRCEPR